ncbi:MAG: hypothetical protein ACREEM_26330 [Blastocatellia bacterium]
MTKSEFEFLRDLSGKEIKDDIVFRTKNATTLSFDEVPVLNSLGLDLAVNGSFVPDIPAVKFNFYVRGIGPICRVEVNSTIHGQAGRTHKHALQTESCPRRNLPHADARPDLENKTAKEVWEIVCKQAKISHIGIFNDPK